MIKTSELTLEITGLIHMGLKDYLLSLRGVLDVNVNSSETHIINIKYNPNLIGTKVLKMEIALFLNLLNNSFIVSFDKHFETKTKKYSIIIEDLCCEYCLWNMMEDLYMIDGIESAKNNFSDELYLSNENIEINISYSNEIISEDEIKKLEIKFND